jgi:hypothetical protein
MYLLLKNGIQFSLMNKNKQQSRSIYVLLLRWQRSCIFVFRSEI